MAATVNRPCQGRICKAPGLAVAAMGRSYRGRCGARGFRYSRRSKASGIVHG